MDKKIWIAIGIIVVISVASLIISFAGYQQATKEKIEIVEPEIPMEGVGLEGPINTGTSNGYLIEFENGVKFYFSGDTALFGDMKFIIGDYYKPEVAFLPIGGFYTMGPKEAAYATTLINSKYAIPYHYHTFPEMAQTADEFVDEVNRYREKGATRAEPVVLEYGVEREIEGIKILWLGHAQFVFESVNGTRIMIDPWLEANPDCPAKYKNFSALEDIDLILLTHGHADHITPEEIDELARLYNPVILAQWELGIYLSGKISTTNIVLFNKGSYITKKEMIESAMLQIEPDIDENIRIMLVYADHSSSPQL